MGISDRILGKSKASSNSRPRIDSVTPSAALPGGEVRITGSHLAPTDLARPTVYFGDTAGAVVISSPDVVVVRVPDEASSGSVTVAANGAASNAVELKVAVTVAENLHPVTNPAIDAQGNLYVTFSGTRGQKVPVSIYKIDTDYHVKPFLTDLMNATSVVFDNEGQMFVTSRYDGTVYRVAANGSMKTFAEGMGVATGLAFDRNGNLYVGDRSGTIFKISRAGETFVFATLEPSVSAYHLAFSATGDLFVTGPTTSSFDCVYRITPQGEVKEFYRGLGRPQGMAFDSGGNLYVAGSLGGKRGIVRITPHREVSLAVSGHQIVGLTFAPGKAAVIATTSAVHYLAWGIEGMPLYG
jgi:sugar lactone lactonase YvrE